MLHTITISDKCFVDLSEVGTSSFHWYLVQKILEIIGEAQSFNSPGSIDHAQSESRLFGGKV